jgi:hypothetical protein
MNSETVKILNNKSVRLKESGLILTVRSAGSRGSTVVIGYPGLPNETWNAETGDALLFETPTAGLYEVRVFSQNSGEVEFFVTQVSPRPGIAGAFVTSEPSNSPFTHEELDRISASLSEVKDSLKSQAVLLPEELALIEKKLDEIESASRRLGRKDWINYAAGAITSTCASAAFAPEVAKSIFLSLNSAFSWLFHHALLLLP